jgi:hypothetical protein
LRDSTILSNAVLWPGNTVDSAIWRRMVARRQSDSFTDVRSCKRVSGLVLARLRGLTADVPRTLDNAPGQKPGQKVAAHRDLLRLWMSAQVPMELLTAAPSFRKYSRCARPRGLGADPSHAWHRCASACRRHVLTFSFPIPIRT